MVEENVWSSRLQTSTTPTTSAKGFFSWREFAWGALASGFGETLMHPVDTLKMRIQGGQSGVILQKQSDIGHALKNILAMDGVRALYRGVVPGISGSMITGAKYFGFIESTNDWLEDERPNLTGPWAHFCAGAIGDTLGSVVYVPCEVLKQRMQTLTTPGRGEGSRGKKFTYDQRGRHFVSIGFLIIVSFKKVRHKNVVQLIGACTKPPRLCIITGGKVADFGVARVQAQSGIMTAETGTYRWMAPEIIELKPYDSKVDVFSFGIVLWELLTGKVPYADLTPLQAAVGVAQKGLRSTIPSDINPKLTVLLQSCWNTDPAERPNFSNITTLLQRILKEVNKQLDEVIKRYSKDKKHSGVFFVFQTVYIAVDDVAEDSL